jgi:hypothetical protein
LPFAQMLNSVRSSVGYSKRLTFLLILLRFRRVRSWTKWQCASFQADPIYTQHIRNISVRCPYNWHSAVQLFLVFDGWLNTQSTWTVLNIYFVETNHDVITNK